MNVHELVAGQIGLFGFGGLANSDVGCHCEASDLGCCSSGMQDNCEITFGGGILEDVLYAARKKERLLSKLLAGWDPPATEAPTLEDLKSWDRAEARGKCSLDRDIDVKAPVSPRKAPPNKAQIRALEKAFEALDEALEAVKDPS